METKFIEATNGSPGKPVNWGKFMVGRFTHEEWQRPSHVPLSTGFETSTPLLRQRGWTQHHVLVMDLQTGEGGIFLPGGLASADLDKHRIWVCPLFEPFLAWLYKQDLADLGLLPNHVALAAPPALAVPRRPGPTRLQADASPL